VWCGLTLLANCVHVWANCVVWANCGLQVWANFNGRTDKGMGSLDCVLIYTVTMLLWFDWFTPNTAREIFLSCKASMTRNQPIFGSGRILCQIVYWPHM